MFLVLKPPIPGLDIKLTMQNIIKKIPEPSSWEPKKYEYSKSSYAEIFKVLQSLRKDKFFCDIKLETDDGKIIYGHKVVLASACHYFHSMFTNFEEKDQDLVIMRQLNSSALQLLVDFIYSGEIMITEKNVQVLLPASNLFSSSQFQEVKDACCDFLLAKLCPTNCIGINDLADLHRCTELLTSSELYIQQHFSEVVDGDEFLSLSSEQLVKLISSDEIKVLLEEKVFECVIQWVKHDLGSRKCVLPQLMGHVRLPLISKYYLLKNVIDEPLLDNCVKCKDYVIEALHFHLLDNSDEVTPFTQISRIKPRQYGSFHKVIFVVGGIGNTASGNTEWYDPKFHRWQIGPIMITSRHSVGLAIVKNNSVFVVGGSYSSTSFNCTVDVLDLSSKSPCWEPTVNMSVKRGLLGVGVLNNCVYAIGGFDGKNCLDRAEVFDCITQKWRMVSSMSTRRSSVGIGVLNNLIYAVGGYDSEQRLNCVECYHPGLDRWTPVAKMSARRSAVGVGVLGSVVYAVGGYDGLEVHRSVEAYRPSTGYWTNVADMYLCRRNAGVVALDGLLYVVGGSDGTSALDSVEFYNPHTNTWTMVTTSMNVARAYLGVVAVDRNLMTF